MIYYKPPGLKFKQEKLGYVKKYIQTSVVATVVPSFLHLTDNLNDWQSDWNLENTQYLKILESLEFWYYLYKSEDYFVVFKKLKMEEKNQVKLSAFFVILKIQETFNYSVSFFNK